MRQTVTEVYLRYFFHLIMDMFLLQLRGSKRFLKGRAPADHRQVEPRRPASVVRTNPSPAPLSQVVPSHVVIVHVTEHKHFDDTLFGAEQHRAILAAHLMETWRKLAASPSTCRTTRAAGDPRRRATATFTPSSLREKGKKVKHNQKFVLRSGGEALGASSWSFRRRDGAIAFPGASQKARPRRAPL